MKSVRLLTLAGLIAGLYLVAGCASTFAPKTAALEHVHTLYREEMNLMEQVPDVASSNKAAPGNAFVRSLNAIHDYRSAYPSDSQELAHLQVLEGMIYLQSRRFGLAAAVKDDVVAAGQKLISARGTEKTDAGDGAAAMHGKRVRDSLFAENFPTLLEGWSETRSTNPRVEAFEAAADALVDKLKNLSATQRPELERDDGALYLATSAAIFYAWGSAREGEVNFAAGPDVKAALAAKKKARDEKSRAIIGEFLTPAEKNANISRDFTDVAQGRLRYVMWYHWFDPSKPAPGSP